MRLMARSAMVLVPSSTAAYYSTHAHARTHETRMINHTYTSLSLLALAFTSHSLQGQAPRDTSKVQARVAISHALPTLDGAHLEAKLVEVTYAPGQASLPHSHPCPVVGYVIEGAVRMQVKGEAEMTYRAGDTFYEAPNGVHAVSANASTTERARFLAYFTCDKATPLSVPVSPPR